MTFKHISLQIIFTIMHLDIFLLIFLWFSIIFSDDSHYILINIVKKVLYFNLCKIYLVQQMLPSYINTLHLKYIFFALQIFICLFFMMLMKLGIAPFIVIFHNVKNLILKKRNKMTPTFFFWFWSDIRPEHVPDGFGEIHSVVWW